MTPCIFLDAQKPQSLFLTGTRVDQWMDAGGSGLCVQTGSLGTGYNPTFDATLFGGKGGVTFSGANQYLESPAVFPLSWARGFTVLCAGTYRAGFFGASDSSAVLIGAALGTRLGLGTAGQSEHGLPLVPCVFGLRWDRSEVSFILNGKTYPVHEGSPITGSGAFGKLQVGGLEPGGSLNADIAGFQIFDAVLGDGDIFLQCAVMQKKYGFILPPCPKYNLVVDGNSLAVGYWSNGVTTMWDGVKAAASDITPLDMVNLANSGFTTPVLTARAQSLIDPLLNLEVPNQRRVLLVWEITNDLSSLTQTDAGALANIQAYCTARKAAGWKVILATCLPRNPTGINTSFETYRLSVNASIRANAVSGGWADAIADIGNDSTIGAMGAYTNTTYYNGDGIHLTAAGHAIAATYITSALAGII